MFKLPFYAHDFTITFATSFLPRSLLYSNVCLSLFVSTNIKHRRYIHLMSNFSSIHFHIKMLYMHMFDIAEYSLYFMEEDWSSPNHFRNFLRQKKVFCMWSKMQVLRFYFVGQHNGEWNSTPKYIKDAFISFGNITLLSVAILILKIENLLLFWDIS